MDIKIYLKTGQIVEFTASEMNLQKNALGKILDVLWVDEQTGACLEHIEVDQIAAITSDKGVSL
ncbi:hypothetical protein J2T12_005090 [Paenibacillus anaericanus]|uniref:hypothetical protein n=1 Tax=Paenibacillus anaericanus TaxID=170367 RepID=UPI0027880A8A|nr:hypothetical protein [Paenibacillus anaericanus]MDQ0091650.1 hypothetical protein [Paenibacillus anaericanus]